MKIDELKKAIKSLIREEVKREVAEEVSKAMSKILVEMVKEIKLNNNSSLIKEETEVDISVPAPIIKTKNTKLNSVLAETAKYYKPLQRTSDSTSNLSQLLDDGFEKIGSNLEEIKIEEPKSKLEFLKQMVGNSSNIQPSVLDGGTEVPDILKKVFKKDFRAVMKKMEEQKRGVVTGNIDTSKLLSG